MLGRDVSVETLPIMQGQTPPQIAQRALQAAKLGGYDIVLLDTAGRTTLDEAMMAEAAEVKGAANPHEVLLVADSLTGQDAVNLARAFNERVGLTGIVLTRVDGDGRGGAALSMRAVTGKPIKLIGTGEKTDALEDFHPARIAGRILGMGDVVSLVEKAAANIDAEKAARVAEKMRKGKFDLADMREQLLQMQNMGGLGGLMGMLPGVAKMKNQIAAANLDDKILKRQVAVIDSMTREERRNPDLLKNSRKKRISAGSRREGRGDQQAPEDAPEHGRHDEGHGPGQARADGRARQHDGFWRRRRHAEPGADERARREDAGRTAARACRDCRRNFQARCRADRACPVSASRRCRASAVFRACGRKSNSRHQTDRQYQEKKMSVVIRLARAGTKKRPVYHIVVADSRFPRDGRFIERLGYFNPLLPKDNETRLKLDLEKVKAWMAKGAQPSDRVMRFLDAAGVAKRKPRNNPQKAVPRKERGKEGAAAA